jgi:hypothetical protein
MLAKNILKMASALTPADIIEYNSIFDRSMPEWRNKFNKLGQILEEFEMLTDILLKRGRGVDRPIYGKALQKLRELQTEVL